MNPEPNLRGKAAPDSAAKQATSGVRRSDPKDEARRLYKQMTDGSLDLSPPSVPPMLDPSPGGDDEPVTEQFDLPGRESLGATCRDRGVLVRVDGPSNGQVHPLSDSELAIGRGSASRLRLTDEGVSRTHAKVIRAGGQYFIQDLESSNGTLLEGRRIRRAPLMEGDLLQFGPNASFRFCMMDHKQECAMMRLFEETTIDALTRTHNRRFMDKRLDEEMAFALRHESDLSIVLLDIDFFKQVNDRHGHGAGDIVLRRVAEVIADQLRTEDILARYGGEEFAVLLRGIPLAGAARVAERVRSAVAKTHVNLGRLTLGVTLSGGCASLSTCPSQTKEDLIAQGDERLYRAKRSGRNQISASD